VKKLKVAVADDEPLARERLSLLVAEAPDTEVTWTSSDGRETVDLVRRELPDVLFLDVQMPELDGLQVLGALAEHERPAAVVFVTAFDEYAIAAFEENAVDYLLKPYTRDRLQRTLARVRERLQVGVQNGVALPVPKQIAVRSREGVQFVRVDDIDWMRADANYVELHAGKSVLRLRETLTDLERRLAPSGFLRVHRSVVVNTDRIARLEPWASGEYLVILRDGTRLNSGRAYGEVLRSFARV
jgi:two-component system LytT family response regulator